MKNTFKILLSVAILILLVNPATAKISKTKSAPQKQASAKVEPDMRPYMANIQKSMKKSWYPPKKSESNRVVVLFRIDRQGNLISCKVVESSDMDDVDNAALEAVRSLDPFPPLPKEFKGKYVDINFTYAYNVFGNVIKPLVVQKFYLSPEKRFIRENNYIYLNGYSDTNSGNQQCDRYRFVVDCKSKSVKYDKKNECFDNDTGMHNFLLNPVILYEKFDDIQPYNDIYLQKILDYTCKPENN